MSFQTANKEILDLFVVAGREVPREDSNMGRAVAILQTICDAQSHTIPDADDEAKDILSQLVDDLGWEGFEGNAACHPYVWKDEQRFDGELIEIAPKAAAFAGLETDVAPVIFEALEEIEGRIASGDDDFTLDFDGNEYRLIKSDEDTIWPIYRDEIKCTVEDCYSDVLKLDKIPSFIAVSVDWEQTAKNAYVDGYGHQFSTYDGSEEEAGGYYIFRTN